MAHLESRVSCLQNKNQQRREDVVPSGAAGLYGYCEDGLFLPTSPSQALARQLSQRESRERSGKALASPFGRGVTAGDGEGEAVRECETERVI